MANNQTPEKQSAFKELVLPVIVLVVICLVCSALLAVLNDVTAPIIEENTKAETLAAYLSVLPEGTTEGDLTEVEGIDPAAGDVQGAVTTSAGAAAVKAASSGYSGKDVTVYVAFDANGTITNISVDASTQTTGIGSKVADDSFTSGFIGWRRGVQRLSGGRHRQCDVFQQRGLFCRQRGHRLLHQSDQRGRVTMAEKPSKWKVFTAGIIRENPVLRLVLGCCSALAVTTTVSGAVGMGLSMTFVLVCSNIVISALRKAIPAKVHLPCYIVIIATFVTVVQMVLQAFVPELYKSLGVFLALIVVNCIILGRAEMFACKNTVVDSALDGLGMGIGYILTMALMSSIREIIGSGTWLGITVIPESVDRMTVMNSAPGGCLMAGCVWLERKLNKPIERKTCGDVMLDQIDAAKAEQKGGAEE